MAAGRGELVVLGAALGAGRWLAEQLMDSGGWTRVVLVDTTAAALQDVPRSPGLVLAAGRDGRFVADTGEAVRLDGATAVVVAVPAGAADGVLADLAAALPPGAEVVVVASPMAAALASAQQRLRSDRVWAAHLLFDPALTSGDGQSVFVAPARAGDAPPPWFARAVDARGGVLRTGSAAEHDAAMTVVQATAHRALVAFADAVTGSGIDLETLWALRTPLFDTLLGLTARALDPRQQTQIAALQAGGAADAPAERLAAAVDGVRDAAGFERTAQQVRDRISGTLFEELRTSATAAVQAAQARRSEIARHRRDGTLVGLRRIGVPDSVRVGRVREVAATRVTLEVLLAGPSGRAALLDGPGLVNAARLGVPPAVAHHDFGIGHVEVVGDLELQRLLDERLAFLPRDVRFLVPESVAGSGVARVVAQFGGLRDVRLVDEVVRTGQRSVVVHLAVRADRDVDATVEAVRREVEAAYAWPLGVTRALARTESTVVYLGPAGTFSEAAARQCAQSIGLAPGRLVALPSFDDVLAAVRPGTLGVLPISSSASGLVGRAVDALLAGGSAVVASGVVDVAVRFDAYVRGSAPLEQHRGAAVYSHPQGLAQCTRFVRRWGLRPVPTASTAEALRLVEQADEPAVALGGAGLSSALRVAEREVDDLSGSITRFLVVGAEGEFAPQRDGSDPTLRAVWIGSDAAAAPALLPAGAAAFSELLTDAAGRFLLVSSRRDRPAPAGVRLLGVLPWSPRTPLVRPGAD